MHLGQVLPRQMCLLHTLHLRLAEALHIAYLLAISVRVRCFAKVGPLASLDKGSLVSERVRAANSFCGRAFPIRSTGTRYSSNSRI